MAVLFASLLLRAAMNRFARSVGSSVKRHRLLSEAAAAFRQEILDESAKLPELAGLPTFFLLPQYGRAFTVVPSCFAGRTRPS